MTTNGQPVKFRECLCPGTPHKEEGDLVFLRSTLGFVAGAEALRAFIESGGDVNRMAELVGPVYVRVAPLGWNVIGDVINVETGQVTIGPVPYDPEVLLGNYSWAYPVAETADDLYSKVVLAPLVKATNKLSPTTPTGTTRRPRRSSPPRPSQRKSSSGNGSAGLLSVVNP